MKVGILELHNYHYDVIDSLCKIFEENLEVLYNNKDILKIIPNKEKIKEIKVLNTISFKSIFKIIKEINKSEIDYIILGTNQNYLIFYLIIFLFCNKRIIMTMHNINVYFKCKKSLKGIIKFLIRKIMLIRCYGINVLGETLKKELEKKNLNKKILNFPVRIYDPYNIKKDNYMEKSRLVISVPGSFELKRRDYETLYKACILLNENKNHITLNFLGKIDKKSEKENKLLNKFKKVADVYYSENFIDEQIFKEKILESDLLINPSVYETFYDGIKEYYGKTKQSGGIYTQIEFAKVGITPSYIEVEPQLESSTLMYKTEEDLYKVISKFNNEKEFRKFLVNEARKNSEKYTLDNIKRNLLKELEE